MTCAELIAKLERFPKDARVLVSGYEMDLDDIEEGTPRLVPVHLDAGTGGRCGQHTECYKTSGNAYCYDCASDGEPTQCVLIPR